MNIATVAHQIYLQYLGGAVALNALDLSRRKSKNLSIFTFHFTDESNKIFMYLSIATQIYKLSCWEERSTRHWGIILRIEVNYTREYRLCLQILNAPDMHLVTAREK